MQGQGGQVGCGAPVAASRRSARIPTQLQLPSPNATPALQAFYWMTNLSSGWYEHHWRNLVQPVLDSGLPFAVNLGNHDGEADLTRRQVVQLAMRTSERSYTKVGERHKSQVTSHRPAGR